MMSTLPPKVLTGDGDDDQDGNWMPSDAEWKSLEDTNVPHELHGIVRMHRNKMPTSKIVEVLNLDPGNLVDEMQVGFEQESDAEFRGVPVHDAGVKGDAA